MSPSPVKVHSQLLRACAPTGQGGRCTERGFRGQGAWRGSGGQGPVHAAAGDGEGTTKRPRRLGISCHVTAKAGGCSVFAVVSTAAAESSGGTETARGEEGAKARPFSPGCSALGRRRGVWRRRDGTGRRARQPRGRPERKDCRSLGKQGVRRSGTIRAPVDAAVGCGSDEKWAVLKVEQCHTRRNP